MFKPEKFRNKTAAVLGAGKSGICCANLLVKNGFAVILSEEKKLLSRKLKEKTALLNSAVLFETGGHSEKIFKAGFAVKSPGIFNHSPIIKELKQRKIPVFSEVETALSLSKCKNILAMTGTNGKTTTTVLLGEIMRMTGGKVRVCGNIGTPVSQIADKAGKNDCIVMEISSYQLEDSSYFHPRISGILNITPDHIDHHRSMENYIKAKTKIFTDQEPGDYCIFNHADAFCLEMSKNCPSGKLFFSSSSTWKGLNAAFENGKILVNFKSVKKSIAPPKLPGTHNIENAMAAALMALAAGAKFCDVEAAFAGFKGVEHRIEEAGTIKEIRFINDSKATNVDSTLIALKALGRTRNIWLILGGLDKGSSYAPLAPFIRNYVKAVLTIGSAAHKIEKELKGTSAIMSSKTLKKAVETAYKKASRGDVILLSPACASFDQFSDFEDRGRQFKQIVSSLKKICHS